MNEKPGTQSTRSRIQTAILEYLQRPTFAAETSNAEALTMFVDQLTELAMGASSEELPTLDQMGELISVTYRLGWRDRENLTVLQRRLIPPTVTILPNADGSWTFLYDGKPRP